MTTGRGRGRSNYRGGRGGRGRGRSNGRNGNNRSGNNRSNNNSNNNATTKLEMKFAPRSTGKRTTAPYATVKDAFVQHVGSEYDSPVDVVKSLRDGTMLDLSKDEPKREISAIVGKDEPTTLARDNEQSGLDMKYQELFRRWCERKEKLEQNSHQAYSMLISLPTGAPLPCNAALKKIQILLPKYRTILMNYSRLSRP